MKYFAAILVLAACVYAQTPDEKTADETRPARAAYPIGGAYPTAYIGGAPTSYYPAGAAYVPAAYPAGYQAAYPAAYPAAFAPTAYVASAPKAAQYQYVAPHAAAYVPHYPAAAQPAYYTGVKAVHA